MPTPTDSSAQPQGLPQPQVEGYERSDVAAKWVFCFFALLFAGGIAIHFLIAWQMSQLEKQPSPKDQWAGTERATSAPPRKFPRLQLSPPADLEAFRAGEETDLTTYGWVNKTAGVVRIPIDQAMDLLLQKGLPMRSVTNEVKAGRSSLELQQQRPLQAEPERGQR